MYGVYIYIYIIPLIFIFVQEDYAGYDFENRLHVRIHAALAWMREKHSLDAPLKTAESSSRTLIFHYMSLLFQCLGPKHT